MHFKGTKNVLGILHCLTAERKNLTILMNQIGTGLVKAITTSNVANE
jgi:hypothetical protein